MGGVCCLQNLIFLAGNILHDMLNTAVQDAAEVIDGGGIQGFILAELIQGGTGNAVILGKGVGGFTGCPEGDPEGCV